MKLKKDASAGKRQASCKEIENHTLCRGAIRNIKSGNSISSGTATSLYWPKLH
jgi:hypothetical protein